MAKRTVVVVLVAAVLAGCGGLPTKVTIESEGVVRPAKRAASAKKATPAPALPAGFTAGPGSSLRAAAPAPTPSPTPLPAAPAYVSVVEAPSQALRVFPVRGGGQLLDAVFAPKAATLSWTLKAPAAGVPVAKVKVEITGAATPFSAETTPDVLGLPATFQGETTLTVPFSLVPTFQALDAAPAATRLDAHVTFFGPDGEAVPGADGAPLALDVALNVL